MQTYKYYIDISWLPFSEPESRRYQTLKSPARRPEIVTIVPGFNGRVYEVSDPFLFYCEIGSEYEYMVYKFGNIRVVKYRSAGDKHFKLCIKSTDLNLGLLNKLVTYNTAIASSVKPFNSYKFYEIEKPIFVEQRYSHYADVVSDKNVLMLSLGETNSFINIGTSMVNLKAKAVVNFSKTLISISLFDVYVLNDEVMRSSYEERHKRLKTIIESINTDDNVKLSIADILEVKDVTDNVIIVDNNEITYMSWSPNPYIYAQLKNSSIVLADGIIEEFFSHSDIDKKFDNEIVQIDINKSCEPAYSQLMLDKFTLYKSYQNKETTQPEILKKENPKYIQAISKRSQIKNYAAGRTLIISDYIGTIYDIEYTEMKFLPDDENELKTLLAKYHTVVIDGQRNWSPKIESLGNKLLLFSGGFAGGKKTWDFKDAGRKTFVFLLGCIGSGKSALVKKVRESLNMSGGIFIAQIDKLIEKDIEFITDPCEETYLRLRKTTYNDHMDNLIGQSMLDANSIILETTHVNNDYVTWLKSYNYHIVVALVNESYENIIQNIHTRNLTKLRKTSLALEKYEDFQKNIPTYTKSADQVIDMIKI